MKKLILYTIVLMLVSCNDDFLERNPLDQPSSETFWVSADNAEMWVNNLYRGLPGAGDNVFEGMSDNAWPRTFGEVGRGGFQSNSTSIADYWDYGYIQKSLEFLEKVEEIPDLSAEEKGKLNGQARFILAIKYYQLITLFREVPLVTRSLSIEESDIPKSPKEEVLTFILEHLDKAVEELPATWPVSENGRATKGAALTLKARILLFNERWSEAATTAKQVMDSELYELHPEFGELFLRSFNNKTKEVILARQYAQSLDMHNLFTIYSFLGLGGFGSMLPAPSLVNSFECVDGLPIDESPLYDETNPFANRDPRYYETFIYPFQTVNGIYYDPIGGTPAQIAQAATYMYYRKYINDMKKGELATWVNWIIFRYADVLLMYAEAKNEVSGPDDSVYDALDLIRTRANMPTVDRARYHDKELLRSLIRNERRVEMAGEGLRYFDIIRWRIAESTQNTELKSIEVPGLLPLKSVETRVFDPARHYVWPIPQFAIDRSRKLEQHPEWK